MDRATDTRATPPISNPLRIVLFGMPHAGKSSLLGALAEVAEHQTHELKGRLDDPTLGLADLQHRLYDGTARQTSEEVVPYPVTFEPFADISRRSALLVDCDGRVANRILTDPNAVQSTHASAPLADAVVHADTLVLVIDAATDPSKLDVDFAEFVTFLRHLRTNRGDRADVGGLPVFLVLSKCDLLAQPEDTLEDWVHRIEEKKQDVARRFQEFIEKQAAVLSFGAIDLDIWATAVKRPPLSEHPRSAA